MCGRLNGPRLLRQARPQKVEKRTADLQWRIVHGVLATNRHAARIDPTVGEGRPFCGIPETLFHVFLQCSWLGSILVLVKNWGLIFLGFFRDSLVIYGPKYSVFKKDKVVILIFLFGCEGLTLA